MHRGSFANTSPLNSSHQQEFNVSNASGILADGMDGGLDAGRNDNIPSTSIKVGTGHAKNNARANSSPRIHKGASALFGFWTKRSTKIEPHPHNTPVKEQRRSRKSQSCEVGVEVFDDQRQSSLIERHPQSQYPISDVLTASRNHLYSSITDLQSYSSAEFMQSSTTTLIAADRRSIADKSLRTCGFMNLHRNKKKSKKNKARGETCDGGSQSDTGEVIRRSVAINRSPNHNRFSHQFSLCCRVDKKPLPPPVTVRYNSIPEALKQQTSDLNWIVIDGDDDDAARKSKILIPRPSRSLKINSPIANRVPANGSIPRSASIIDITECLSAPDSPILQNLIFPHGKTHNSPSHLSTTSQQGIVSSDSGTCSGIDLGTGTASGTSIGTITGPIRPISVSACRSRLRLKLYPPGKVLPPFSIETGTEMGGKGMRRTTTPQHMSSPNIATQTDIGVEDSDISLRYMSYENFQLQRDMLAGNDSSASILTKDNFITASALNTISTEKVRERSFLDGRLGSCSLMGPSELLRILPNKEVTIFVGTWNMNGQSPPKQMNDFVLPTTMENLPDLVAIGTQESSPDRFDWESTLQETLGPSHVLFHSIALGTLHLAVYMRRDLIWYCSAPEDASLSVRTGTAFRTKGAVAISFSLFGTSMLFVTSHLTAHHQKVKERVSDVKRIIHALDLPKNLKIRNKSKDVTQNFDNVFWCGDLNFRLSEPREKLLEWIQNTKFPLPSHLPHGYMYTDQLSSVLSDGAAFRGFLEANITFPPTYKYDPGTQHFDTSSKQRAPAYTDRILYKFREAQGLIRHSALLSGSHGPGALPYVECLQYDSVPSITTSDHKPVWALFRTLIRAGSDSIPLAAGLFNRDIYLEGIRRRLHNQYSGSSAVCSIQ